jgi:O-antigen/teichoic acid export membrane protein
MSSLTNFLLSSLVARSLGTEQFGAFTLAYVTYGFASNASRGISIEPLLVRFSSASLPEWRRATAGSTGTALLAGLVTGACALALAPAVGGTTGQAFLALGLTFPGLLLQDSWRFAFFALGRGYHAFVNDAIWATVQIPALVALKLTGHANVFTFTLAWGVAATVAAVAGSVQARVVPSMLAAASWLVKHRDLGPRYLLENTGPNVADMVRSYSITSILGLVAVGSIQAANVLMGPFKIVLLGLSLITIPEGARLLRRSPERLPLYCAAISAVLTLLSLAWGAVLLIALPHGLGRLALGYVVWRQAYPLVLATSLTITASCAGAGPIIGLHAMGASRRSMRAMLLTAGLVVVAVLAGAITGGIMGTVTWTAVAAWIGTLVSWRELRQAFHESDTISVPIWMWPPSRRGLVRMPSPSEGELPGKPAEDPARWNAPTGERAVEPDTAAS